MSDQEIIAEFILESTDALDRLEPMVVSLDEATDASETLHAIFRMVHSIKGTASFCDLPILTDVAHSAESLLDGLRHRTLRITKRRVDALCNVVDFLRFAFSELTNGAGEAVYEARAAELVVVVDGAVAELSSYGREPTPVTLGTVPPVTSVHPSVAVPSSLQLPTVELEVQLMPELLERFTAESEEHLVAIEHALLAIEQGRGSSDDFSEAFRCMHSLKGNCGIIGLGDLEEITHVLETALLGWNQGKTKPAPEQVTTILGIIDVVRRTLAELPIGRGEVHEKATILRTLADLSMAAPEKKRLKRKISLRPSQIPGEEERERRTSLGPNRTEGKDVVKLHEQSQERTASSIRVDTRKLDELMNLVGELIIAETTVTHNPDLEGHDFENFQKAALHLNRITRMLQDVTMQARMIPIETTFRKMVRLVRDVAHKQGKEVALATTGEETEVDKSVIETIGDPLVHLIRNAIDHGLEEPPEREAAGKSRIGHVKLEARHQGGEVWISISDDGRGIDPEKVLASALKKGVAEPSRIYTRQEILNFIFAPGFSTAAKLTDISGRGVGMDVVKRNVERVNGRIDIETAVGLGTTFTLRIPLTLAIIEGMLVRVGGAYYTIPLLSIKESVRTTPANVTSTSSGQELLRLRERHHPIVKLKNLFWTPEENAPIEQGILVLVESGDEIAGLLVDEVVGQRQTVIKPLPEYLREVRTLAGCSILHNGEISLILDVDALVRSTAGSVAA